MWPVVLAAIIIILILIYYGWNCSLYDYEEYLGGMWRGDDAFCEESGVSSMLLYIGKPTAKNNRTSRDGYLVINNNVTNQAITLEYTPSNTSFCRLGEYAVDVNIAYTEDEIMPKNVKLRVNMKTGSLKIYQKDKMYGLFYRDGELSAMTDDA